jgi:TorA maturation chaperone TorD/Fe-S-cluster-containing hydrogenase component 2
MRVRTSRLLAELYAGLAEVLAQAGRGIVPDWLGYPGREWPLFIPVQALAAQTGALAWQQAAMGLAAVTRGSRTEGCQALFVGNGRPPILLYESWHVDGRFPTTTTFAVQTAYRQAGLDLAGELADHAAVELEFLSLLAEQEEEDAGQAQKWRTARYRFLQEHAGRWLPDVGRSLMSASDASWAAVGLVLTAVFSPNGKRRSHLFTLPVIPDGDRCSLCGFCVQVCPTNALGIVEDDRMTRLQLLATHCIHCAKCKQVCNDGALVMIEGEAATTAVSLFESPRARCPSCTQATVSEAEIDAVVTRLGSYPAWLDYCLQCR